MSYQVSAFLIAMASSGFTSSYDVTNNNGALSAGSLGAAIEAVAGNSINSEDTITITSPFSINISTPYSPLIKSVLGSVTILSPSSTSIVGGIYTIFDFSGGGTLSAFNLSLTGNVNIQEAKSTLAGSLTFNGVNLTLDDGAIVSAALNLNSPPNTIIVNSGTATISGAMSGTSPFSLSSGGGAVTLSIAGPTLSTGNINIGNNTTLNLSPSGAVTYAGVLSGLGALSIGGVNTVTLTGVNTYSGGTTLTEGTLRVSAANQLGTGAITFNAGTLITSQVGALALTQAITLGGAATVTVSNAAATTTLSGIISSGGALTVNGPGTLVLSGVNTYSGGTTLTEGTLRVSADNQLGAAASGISFNGGTLQTTTGITSARPITLGAGGGTIDATGVTITFNGNVGGTTPLSITGGTVNLNGVLSGTMALSIGGATVSLGNVGGIANSFSGGTSIGAGGLVQISAGNQLGTGGITLTNSTLQIANTLAVTQAITFAGIVGIIDLADGVTATLSGIISGAGLLNLTNSDGGGNSVVILENAGNSYNGASIGAGVTAQISAPGQLGMGGVTLTEGGAIQTTAGLTGAQAVTQAITLGVGGGALNATGFTSEFSGLISGGALSITGGTVILSGANTYNQGTNVAAGATVQISAANQLGTGGVTLTNSTLQIANTLAVTQAITLVDPGGTIDLIGGVTATLSGIISGANLLNLTNSDGAGGSIAVLANAGNSYSGSTSIGTGVTVQVSANNQLGSLVPLASLVFNGGGLETTTGFSSARSVAMTGNGTFTVDPGQTTILTGALSGPGTLTKAGTGILSIQGSTMYAGATILNVGRTFDLSPSANLTYAGAITGAGGLSIGVSTPIVNTVTLMGLTGINTYTGSISIGGGATLNLSPAAALTYGGGISGAGNLTIGANIVTFTAANTYTGTTTLAGGILQVSNDNQLGDVAASLVFNGGTLQTTTGITSARTINLGAGGGAIDATGVTSTFNGNVQSIAAVGTSPFVVSGGTVNLTGVISDGITGGATALSVAGATVVLGNLGNSYSGSTSIGAGGLIQISAANQLSTGGLALTGGGSLQTTAGLAGAQAVTQAITLGAGGGTLNTTGFTSEFSGHISDAGGGGGPLSIVGGTVILSGANTYSQGTDVAAGATVQISAANQLGTGGVMLTNSTLQATNTLAVTQAITLVDPGGTIDLAGGVTATLSGIISGASLLNLTNSDGAGGSVAILMNVGNTYGGGTSIGAGVTAQISNGNQLGTGAVTLTNSTLQATNTLTAGQAITLLAPGGTIDLAGGVTATLSGIISGAGPLMVTNSDGIGNSQLVLSNLINSFTGGVSVGSGTTLQINNNSQLGNIAGGITFNGSALATTATLASARLVTLGAGGGTFNVANGTTTTLSGGFIGIGNLTTSGLGTLALTGATLPNGNLIIGVGSTLNLSPSVAISYGNSITGLGTLAVGNNNLTLTGPAYTVPIMVGNGNTLNLAPIGGLLTYSGVISGNGAVAISSGNSVALTGTNTYSGGTTVDGNTTLIVSNSDQLGSGPITLDNGILQLTADVVQAINLAAGGGTFYIPQGQTVTLQGALTGAGVLTKTGLGTLVIGGPSLSTGNIVISAGILNLAPSGPVIYAGAISGAGALTVSNNTVTLTGTNTSAGPTTVTGGVLQVSNDNQLGSLLPAVASVALSGGTLRTALSVTSDRIISLTGNGTIDISAGATTTLNGQITETIPSQLSITGLGILAPTNLGNNYSAGTNIGAGVTLQINDSGEIGSGPVTFTGGTLETTAALTLPQNITLITVGGALNANGVTSEFSGLISDAVGGGGPLSIAGGTVILSGGNTYGQGTNVAAGATVQISAGNQLGTGAVTLTNSTLQATSTLTAPQAIILAGLGGTIDLEDKVTATLSGIISGAGSLNLTNSEGGGSSVAILSNAGNTYGDGTSIGGGVTAQINAASQLGTGAVALMGGGILQVITDLTGAQAITQAITLGAGGGVLDPSYTEDGATNSFTIECSGPISDAGGGGGPLSIGNFVQGGTVILSQGGAGNTYTQGTNVAELATAQISNGNQLGTGAITLTNSTLRATSNLTVPQAINLVSTMAMRIMAPRKSAIDLAGGVTATLSGIISGGGVLTMSNSDGAGGSQLILSNLANSFSGGVSVSDGVTLQISNDNQLGNGGGITLDGGTLATTATLSSARLVALEDDGGTFNVAGGTTTTLSGGFIGIGNLTTSGLGTLALTGATLPSGNLIIGAGSTLNLSPSVAISYGNSITGSGTLAVSNSNLTLTGSTYSVPTTVNGILNLAPPRAGMTYSGTISGNGSITMEGGGSIALSAASNTYTGGTTITENTTLEVSNSNQLGSGSITLDNGILQSVLPSGTLTLDQVLNLTGDGTIMVSNSSANVALTGSANGASSLTLAGPGSLDLTGFTNTATGNLAINSATVLINQASQLGNGSLLSIDQGILQTTQSAADPLTLSQAIALDSNNGGTFEVTTASAVTTLSGIVSGGPLFVSGSGAVVLSNTGNSYNGTTIDAGSTVSITAAGNLGSSSGALDLIGGTLNVGGLSLMGPQPNSTLHISQPIVLTGGGVFDIDTSQITSLDGIVSGTGPLSIIGGGTVALTNNGNSYTNGTEVSDGSTLSVSADAQLGNPMGSVIIDGGSIFQPTATFTSARPFTLGTLGGMINVGSNITTTLSNGITGSGLLTKTGLGTLTLGGTNSVDSTTVNQGSFLLSGGATLASPVTIASGAFFGGIGSITGNVTNNGTITPQGNLAIVGDLTNAAASVYQCDISPSGTSDQIKVTGTANLDGTLQVVPAPGTYKVGSIYTILTAATALNGTFSSIMAPTGFSAQTAYGNDAVTLTLTAVPSEPPTPPPAPPAPPTPTSKDMVQSFSSLSSTVGNTISSHVTADSTESESYDDGFHFSPINFEPSRVFLPKRHASGREQTHSDTLQSILYALSQKGPIILERQQNRLWISAYYSYGRNDIDATTTAISHDEGILVGFDWRSPSSIVGFIVGGGTGKQTSPSNIPQDNTVDSKSMIFGFYHSLMFLTDGRYDLVINGVGSRRRSKRFGSQGGVNFEADGDFNSYDITADLSTSWVFHLPEQFSIRPNIGATVGYTHQNPFSEVNAGTFNQSYASNRQRFIEPYVGIGVRREWKNNNHIMKLTGVVEQGYEVISDSSNILFFSTTGPVNGTTIVPLNAGRSSTTLITRIMD